jgi:peptide/nickel transport system permease protein
MARALPSRTLAAPAAPPARHPATSLWADAFRRFRKHRLATVGAALLIFMVVAVLAGPFIYRVPIDEIDFKAKLKSPSWAHPLGTDDLGQDLLARMLYGGRISLAVGIVAMLIALTIGVAVGAAAGHFAGAADHGLMRVTDLFLCLPQLPLLLLIVYLFRETLKKALGPEAGVFVMIVVVIGGLRWMPVARLVRAQFLSLREKEFVEAAKMTGASDFRIMRSHLLPHLVGPVIVYSTLIVAQTIIAEAGLSFLGLGIELPNASWGNLLQQAKDFYLVQPWLMVWPGLAILLTTLAFNLLGDGLRDAFDPRARI